MAGSQVPPYEPCGLQWQEPARPGQAVVTVALWPRAALEWGRAGVLTGAASQAHTPGRCGIVLAAAVGSLGAVWGGRGGQRGQGGACRERQRAQMAGMATCPLWAWPQHLSLLGRPHSALWKPPATRTCVPGARVTGEQAAPLTQTHLYAQPRKHAGRPKVRNVPPRTDPQPELSLLRPVCFHKRTRTWPRSSHTAHIQHTRADTHLCVPKSTHTEALVHT